MKSKRTTYFRCFSLLILLTAFIFMTGCNSSPPAVPIVNSFSSIPLSIIPGEDCTLGWSVTNATSVVIDQGIGSVNTTTDMISVSPAETTVYTLTATNAAGSVTATTTISVTSVETLTLKPGSEGKDTFVTDFTPNANYDNNTLLCVGVSISNIWRAYLKFDLSPNPLPSGAVVIGADLRLNMYEGPGRNVQIELYRVKGNWSEDAITWNNQPTSSPVLYGACSIDSSAIGGWYIWHIDDLVKDWLDGSINNYGIVLRAVEDESLNEHNVYFYSSNGGQVDKHPELRIYYYMP